MDRMPLVSIAALPWKSFDRSTKRSSMLASAPATFTACVAENVSPR